MKLFRLPAACSTLTIGLTWLVCGTCSAQVVQLPTLNTFSIQTSVAVPDGGSMSLGGIGRAASGSMQRGPASAYGASNSASGVSVHATIIDLDEFDRMIRSQASKKPTVPDLSVKSSHVNKHFKETVPRYEKPAEYAYLMAMSHSVTNEEQAIEDARHYLALAADARQRGHWASVELYYRLAWKALPEKRRGDAMHHLEVARSTNASDATGKSAATNGSAAASNTKSR
jgi:hypothetical protein